MLINKEKYLSKEEIYDFIYTCPSCGEGDILSRYKYCPMCGNKIIWEGQHSGCKRSSCDECDNPYNPKWPKLEKCNLGCTPKK